jgi:uncharacterized protein HemY
MEKEGDMDGARAAYEAALSMFPFASGKEDPRLKLAEFSESDEVRIDYLEEHLKTTFEDLKVRDQLIDWYRERDDHEAEFRHLQAKMKIHPLDPQIHSELGQVARKVSEWAVAELHLRSALEVLAQLPPDAQQTENQSSTMTALASVLARSKDTQAEAYELALKASELDPSNQDAQKLLRELKVQGAGVGR